MSKGRKYYLFFAFCGDYPQCYTEFVAQNKEDARCKAAYRYGLKNIGSIENDEEKAKIKIKTFGLTRI